MTSAWSSAWSRSWTTWLRLSPTYRKSSNRVGRSMAAHARGLRRPRAHAPRPRRRSARAPGSDAAFARVVQRPTPGVVDDVDSGSDDVTDAVNTTLAADAPAPEPAAQVVNPAEYRKSFFRWGAGAYLITTGVLFAYCLTQTGGKIVYLIDDPAIHL